MGVSSIYHKNRLSIFILQDGFSFLLLNDSLSPSAFKKFKLTGSPSTSELLKLITNHISPYLNTIETLEVIYGNLQFSIVPQDYFDETHLPHYLKYSSKLIEGDDFAYDEIPSIHANTVYIPYVNINNYLFDNFGSFKFTHLFTGLIEKAFKKSLSSREYVDVHVGQHTIYVTAFGQQKLLTANAFTYETPEDFAYYILFCIQELHLNREELKMEFTGHFFNTEENTALAILSTYIRHISFSNTTESFGFDRSEGFHEHFNLL